MPPGHYFLNSLNISQTNNVYVVPLPGSLPISYLCPMEWIFSLENIEEAAGALLQHTGNMGVIAFYGQMGAGKTTFIKALCQVLGTGDQVNSPTFTLVNEYLSAEEIPIYHFDFYRIKNLQEAVDIGCEEYFETPGTLSLIEWPELITPLLPPEAWQATLEVLSSGKRKLTMSRG